MRLLHVHGAPVVAAVLQLDVRALHQPVLRLAAERSEVCGQVLNVKSTLGLQRSTQKKLSLENVSVKYRVWQEMFIEDIETMHCKHVWRRSSPAVQSLRFESLVNRSTGASWSWS